MKTCQGLRAITVLLHRHELDGDKFWSAGSGRFNQGKAPSRTHQLLNKAVWVRKLLRTLGEKPVVYFGNHGFCHFPACSTVNEPSEPVNVQSTQCHRRVVFATRASCLFAFTES